MTDLDIVLHLNRSRSSHAFHMDESLWHDEVRRILALVVHHIYALEYDRHESGYGFLPENGWIERHDRQDFSSLSIALFGTYGSGKSSLLRTLVSWVNNRELKKLKCEEGDRDYLVKFEKHIYSLPVIEPNVITPDDNFLYAFLAAALEADLYHRRMRNPHRAGSQILSPVQQKFQALSEYLQAVDVKNGSFENDPLGISLERLDRHSSVLRLREKLDDFLNTLADELTGEKENSVLLLPVDDADMRPAQLIDTFNTYRLYLQHPRLIPIFTFTGRMAEELLRIHFERELTMDGQSDRSKIHEAATDLSIPENLALQYLGKLFPVRNRIKLSQASEMVRHAKYRLVVPERNLKLTVKIEALLKTASQLLFGVPERPMLPEIRSPLQSALLRRQLQILDAMRAANMDKYLVKMWLNEQGTCGIPEEAGQWDKYLEYVKERPKSLEYSWARIFSGATWALLNSHRDVLKEYDLNLDDLYSWNTEGLRRVVLKSVLKLSLERRRQLIQNWRYRTSDRRSQMLSLLAANTFRPKMFGEGIGDRIEDPEIIKRLDTFSVRKGTSWFLQLWIGFYLPQILGRDRPNDPGAHSKDYEPVSGVGWNLRNGPIHAIREGLLNGLTLSTGMLFLDVQDFQKTVKTQVDDGRERTDWFLLLGDLWCYYGIHHGRHWAAVSFWRGLGLMGQLVQIDIEFRAKYTSDERESQNSERLEQVEGVIWRHLENAKVMGTPSAEDSISREAEDEFGRWRYKNIAEIVGNLAEEIVSWLDNFPSVVKRIDPMLHFEERSAAGNREKWKSCFIRRMHGENLLSLFWQELENPYARESDPAGIWTARDALQKWCWVLTKYWDCGKEIDEIGVDKISDTKENSTQRFILTCPFIKPFAPLLKSQFSKTKEAIKKMIDLFITESSDKDSYRKRLMAVVRELKEVKDQNQEEEIFRLLNEKFPMVEGIASDRKQFIRQWVDFLQMEEEINKTKEGSWPRKAELVNIYEKFHKKIFIKEPDPPEDSEEKPDTIEVPSQTIKKFLYRVKKLEIKIAEVDAETVKRAKIETSELNELEYYLKHEDSFTYEFPATNCLEELGKIAGKMAKTDGPWAMITREAEKVKNLLTAQKLKDGTTVSLRKSCEEDREMLPPLANRLELLRFGGEKVYKPVKAVKR